MTIAFPSTSLSAPATCTAVKTEPGHHRSANAREQMVREFAIELACLTVDWWPL